MDMFYGWLGKFVNGLWFHVVSSAKAAVNLWEVVKMNGNIVVTVSVVSPIHGRQTELTINYLFLVAFTCICHMKINGGLTFCRCIYFQLV